MARLGVPPIAWVHFVEAAAWAWDSHVPYAQEDDKEDLALGAESAVLRAVTQHVAIPAIHAWTELNAFGNPRRQQPSAFNALWQGLEEADRVALGERVYRKLFQENPGLLDYFSSRDTDSLAIHLVRALDIMVLNAGRITAEEGPLRSLVDHLGEVHRNMGVPSYSYPLMGHSILACLEPFFQEEENRTKFTNAPTKSEDLANYFTRVYSEFMSLVYYPVAHQEKLIKEARDFYEKVSVELSWSGRVLERRMLEIEQEIIGTGTYTQTIEEIQVGARLAWRNSAKCIGRISWNTLQVRDCRHVSKPEEVFKEVEEHLKIATGGTNIQSVMTVFRPLHPGESIGPRFWSEQFVRYAGYRDDESGKVIGDSANVGLTKYLEENHLWEPPDPIRSFDVLPLVYKMPGHKKPRVHKLCQDCLNGVDLEHPHNEAFRGLGLRWTTVPAISNFRLALCRIIYQNCPFNGWFVSTEVTRNIIDRYQIGSKVADVFEWDTVNDPFWQQAAALEVDRAVVHSFRKNGVTIVDPHLVGESFCVHVRREREQHGLECPAQWSWIGGLVGHTNDTWHLEMRDFEVAPQYDYCVDGCTLYNSLEYKDDFRASSSMLDSSMSSFSGNAEDTEENRQIPKVAILYGSETGQAEGVARHLKRLLRILKPTVMTLNQATGLQVLKPLNITHILCITSTFGKGEPPLNARKFFNANIRKMSGVSYSVLALGSMLYPDFCKAGTDLDTKFERAGFQRMTNAVTKADEASGAEKTIKDWLQLVKRIILPNHIEQLVQLRTSLGPADGKVEIEFKWHRKSMNETIDVDDPPSLCLANEEIAGPGCSKPVHKVTLELPYDVMYTSGDHLAVTPTNSPVLVERFLTCFQGQLTRFAAEQDCPSHGNPINFISTRVFELVESIEGKVTGPSDVPFALPSTLSIILTSNVDLTMKRTIAIDLLTTCIEACEKFKYGEEAGSFRNTIEEDHVDDFLAQFPTVVHFFEKFGFLATIVRLPDILALLPRLQPRYYSVSSSGISARRAVSITVGVLTTKTSQGAKLEGVCSHFLSTLKPNIDGAYIQIRPSSFRLPESLACPMIMVAAGTGIAPLMGFLEDLHVARLDSQSVGQVHLFFGCRKEADFLYEANIRKYVESGMVTLYLALSCPSKPGTPKQYVQHLLAEQGAVISDLIMNHTSRYYVCGDACMAQDCHEAVIGTLRNHQHMSRVEAAQLLKRLAAENRWQSDVWGIVSDQYEHSDQASEHSKRAAKIWLSKFRRSSIKNEDLI